ncbi:RNA polymerase sigma factor SigB [Numidum massiliense]|uniref:RNA polymerase sigma factor SigB n=1 Tax=Numidum massiliense TaxID=1522315 RepID=UPI0006D569EC|nr:RNA polymerase sigma factor SigB [Numidum massiliense]
MSANTHLRDNGDLRVLIEQYQSNPTRTLQHEIVNRYRKLVESLAASFAGGNESYEDLVQVGMIGLLGALERYDPRFETSFEGFAVPTIVGEIKRYIRDKTWSVHVPRRIKELGPRIKKAVDVLTAYYQRSPKIYELAEYLQVTEEEILETMEMGRSYHALSFDSPIEADGDGSTVTMLDLIGVDEDGYERVNRQVALDTARRVLSERENTIIHLTFYENLSQKKAGEALGISQMHVSRLQRRALKKLKHAMHMDACECF